MDHSIQNSNSIWVELLLPSYYNYIDKVNQHQLVRPTSVGTRILEAPQPLKIASLSPLKVLEISCGENHSALVTEDGKLLTFGDGRHGKLCLDVETLTNHYTPVPSSRFRVRTTFYLIN